MQWLYLASLVFSGFGMAVIDYKYCLAFCYDKRRTLIVLLVALGVFTVWDVLGISLGIFFSGHSKYMSGWYLFSEYPIEEMVFLLFLSYFTLIIYRLGEKIWPRT